MAAAQLWKLDYQVLLLQTEKLAITCHMHEIILRLSPKGIAYIYNIGLFLWQTSKERAKRKQSHITYVQNLIIK